MGRWVTPRKRVTSPTWGPPPPCKHNQSKIMLFKKNDFPIYISETLKRAVKETNINITLTQTGTTQHNLMAIIPTKDQW